MEPAEEEGDEYARGMNLTVHSYETARLHLREAVNCRRTALARIAIFSGCVLGYLSVYVDSLTVRTHGHPAVGNDIAGIILGAIVGAGTLPFIRDFCYSRDLRMALPIIYGVTVLTVIIATLLASPFVAAIWGFIMLGTASIVVFWGLPRTVRGMYDGTCGWCGYDVTGGGMILCPECGRDCDPASGRLVGESNRPVLGEITLSQFLRDTLRHKRLVFLTMILVVIVMGRYVGPHFSITRFQRVDVGWTDAEVRRLLGRPDTENQNSATESTWTWEISNFLFPDYYEISFESGVVESTNSYSD